ncbi:hypothetical protein Tsubulata_025528 [Turnera subulata]|uniref:Ribosomal RNA small subunit methyltransferase NEP1 n=1 Tax=Turnera subulata TaxID=218843 RepID=A0A9Q0FJW9_9ROSI|nr:hypothetical protein Tsubulata_025528 [Turnera subulata]
MKLQPCSGKQRQSNQIDEEEDIQRGQDEKETVELKTELVTRVAEEDIQRGEEEKETLELKTELVTRVAEEDIDKKETMELKTELVTHVATEQLPRIPLVVARPNKTNQGVIFVLEQASLVLAHVGKRYRILHAEEHGTFLRKKNLNPSNYRPDIVHEALVEIMDSRLRMAGNLKAVYIRTDDGILIKVDPNARIPRSLETFCDMMVELLQKFSIKAKGHPKKLLSLVKNPITQHLPASPLKLGLSFSSQKKVHFRDYVSEIKSDQDIVFVVGTMAHGKIESDYLDDVISVSGYPLSAAVCLRHICTAFERKWNIH